MEEHDAHQQVVTSVTCTLYLDGFLIIGAMFFEVSQLQTGHPCLLVQVQQHLHTHTQTHGLAQAQ